MKKALFCITMLLALAAITPVIAAPKYFPDMDVLYVSRTPRYDRYNVSYQSYIDPRDYGASKPYLDYYEQEKQRWPNRGDVVTYTAYIKNNGHAATGNFQYKWYMDGVQVASGTIASIPIGGTATATYQWTWDSELIDHKIKFMADPSSVIAEENESNNTREDYTNALCYRFHVWQSLYDYFRTNIKNYDPKLASFEDWMQKQVGYMNQIFKESAYPLFPNGIPEHVRIDEIVLHPDDYPDPESWATHATIDWQWDGRWGYNNDYIKLFNEHPEFLSGLYTWGLHEQTHQLGMIDLYQMDIAPEQNYVVPIGRPNSRSGCVMATSGASHYSDQTAYAMAANLHKRRGYFGEYLYDVPNTCKIRLLDAYYKPVPNATIKFYQLYNRQISSYVDFQGTTDAQGYYTMPNRNCYGSATTATGHTLRNNPWGMINVVGFNGTFFCEVAANGQTDYQYFDILPFNVAFRSGFTDTYTYNLQTSLLPEGRPTDQNLYGVKMLASNLGWAVGASGTFLKWDGKVWTPESVNVSAALRAIDCDSSSGMACVVGDAGVVLIYSNGSWQQKNLGQWSSASLSSCQFVAPNTIIIAGASGCILRSNDGGDTWTSLNSPSNTSIRSMRFADPNNGIFVSDGSHIWCTSDGGVTWTQGTGIPATVSIRCCDTPTPTDAWAITDNGYLYRSADGGNTWTSSQSDNYPGPVCMDMKAGGNGWISRGYDSYCHQYQINRIENYANYRWYDPNVVSYNNSDTINSIASFGLKDVWAVGQNGLIIHIVWQGADSYVSGNPKQIIGKPDGTAVNLTNTIATGSFDGSVYVESTDRSNAFRVETNQSFTPGQTVKVTGIMDTDVLEKVIRYGDITPAGVIAPVKPLGVIGKSIKSSATEPGLVISALLVRVSGTVTKSGTGWFTVDDGSGKIDSEGNKGVKVTVTGMTPPDEDSFVRVTGICSFEKVSGKTYPLIRARGSADIQTGKG